jgi:penicillin-binding protein 1A
VQLAIARRAIRGESVTLSRLGPAEQRPLRILRVLKWLVVLALTVAVSIGAVVLLATYEELTATLPPIDRLLDYDPPVATRVYADDGSLIEEFFRERRYRVPIEDIPPLVSNAFIAAEDAKFFKHRGVDFAGIARAAAANIKAGDVVQGGSTITQQVVKALLLTPERSYERKLKEILLSLRLEQSLTKQQILELYLNQIYLGDGNHGVGAAARNYFGKPVQKLTAAEAAMLAGLPAAPSRYSPNRAPDAARTRQLYVLRRMLEEHFLTAADYQEAVNEKLHLVTKRQQPTAAVRNYYTETVRLQLEDMFGAEAPYNQGYSVYTALQPRLQNLAETAVRNGIERIDKALGYRGPVGHLPPHEQAGHIAQVKEEIGDEPLDPERIYQGVVTSVASGRIRVAVGAIEQDVSTSGLRWNGSVKSRTFRTGDIVEVRTREPATSGGRTPPPPVEEEPDLAEGEEIEAGALPAKAESKAKAKEPVDPAEAPLKLYLAQTPQIEAALVAVDTDSGGIAAMVGGYDFIGSPFNRALQALRQPGSAFKPFVYAAALDHGYTAASMLQDSPVEYMDNDKVWAPRNYTRDYKGPIRLRTALEQSRNVVSVKLVDAVGVKTVVDYLSRFHLDTSFGPNLSIALGTSEMTLRALTEGYTAFANGGVKVEPVIIRRIEDKDGIAFFSDEPKRREVLSPATAAVMTYILEGVVERGTATSVRALDRPVAGKTGTTNEQRDAWFVGYTPNLTVGVWVGFDDQNQTMGKMGTGGRVAAPIWLDFMKPALAGTPVRDFEIPDNITCVNIDPYSGKRAGEWTSKPLLECFKEGTEPGVYVAAAETEDDGATIWSDTGSSPPDTNFNAPTGDYEPNSRAEIVEDAYRQLGDPRYPVPRDSEARIDDRWADPYGQRREGPRLRAEAVETDRGTEVRLYRDSAPPPDAPGDTRPGSGWAAPAQPSGQGPSSAAPLYESPQPRAQEPFTWPRDNQPPPARDPSAARDPSDARAPADPRATGQAPLPSRDPAAPVPAPGDSPRLWPPDVQPSQPRTGGMGPGAVAPRPTAPPERYAPPPRPYVPAPREPYAPAVPRDPYAAPAPREPYSPPAPRDPYAAPAPREPYSPPAPRDPYAAPAPRPAPPRSPTIYSDSGERIPPATVPSPSTAPLPDE